MSLERFRHAQENASSGYLTALAEIRRGHKSSHWIWYIFPQIDGLGRSSTAREFALRDLEEACDYLRDAQLRFHYEEIARAVDEQLRQGVPVERLMGGGTDALKLASSLTLFRAAARRLAAGDPSFESLAKSCDDILAQMTPQGYAPCAFTLAQL